MSQGQQKPFTYLKINLQQSRRFQDFFHGDKSAKEQATLVNAQSH